MRNKWPFVGVSSLAILTVVLAAMAILHVRPSETAAVPAEIPELPTVAPAPTPSSTDSPRPPRVSSTANIRSLLAGPDGMKVVVVGDATGADDPTTRTIRWVSLWAQELAGTRPVTLHRMDTTGEYDPGEELGPHAGARVEIYNASDRPGQIVDVIEQANRLIPPDADVVIFNFGHNETESSLRSDLTSLFEKLPEGCMGLVMVQNPQGGEGQAIQQGRIRVVRQWAQQGQLPAVDINQAFLADPKPLADLLGADRINPNMAGSEVWLEAVSAVLG